MYSDAEERFPGNRESSSALIVIITHHCHHPVLLQTFRLLFVFNSYNRHISACFSPPLFNCTCILQHCIYFYSLFHISLILVSVSTVFFIVYSFVFLFHPSITFLFIPLSSSFDFLLLSSITHFSFVIVVNLSNSSSFALSHPTRLSLVFISLHSYSHSTLLAISPYYLHSLLPYPSLHLLLFLPLCLSARPPHPPCLSERRR